MKFKPISLFAMLPVLVACGGAPASSGSANATSNNGNEGNEANQAPAWNAECVAVRGCGEPQTLSPCGEAPFTIDLAAAQEGVAGSTVTVRAYLAQAPGMMTLMGCAPGACCNHASASLVLVAAPVGHIESPDITQLRLEGEDFACPGDDSGVCCSYRVDASAAEVLVTGTLVGEPGAITLQPASICTL